MSENEVPKAWSEYYKAEYTREEIKRHLSNFRFFLAKCEEHFGGRKILEIGTGSGIVTAHFAKRGYEVTGLDYDPGVIEIGKRVSRSMDTTPSFAVGDMFQLPFRPASFDACYHQGLMEHFDPPEIVRALTAQLRIARKVVFAVPTSRWHGGVRGDERMWPGSRWKSLLAGFRILDVFALGYHDLPSRGAFVVGRRFTGLHPRFLFRTLALHRAAQIGFVITAHGQLQIAFSQAGSAKDMVQKSLFQRRSPMDGDGNAGLHAGFVVDMMTALHPQQRPAIPFEGTCQVPP